MAFARRYEYYEVRDLLRKAEGANSPLTNQGGHSRGLHAMSRLYTLASGARTFLGAGSGSAGMDGLVTLTATTCDVLAVAARRQKNLAADEGFEDPAKVRSRLGLTPLKRDTDRGRETTRYSSDTPGIVLGAAVSRAK